MVGRRPPLICVCAWCTWPGLDIYHKHWFFMFWFTRCRVACFGVGNLIKKLIFYFWPENIKIYEFRLWHLGRPFPRMLASLSFASRFRFWVKFRFFDKRLFEKLFWSRSLSISGFGTSRWNGWNKCSKSCKIVESLAKIRPWTEIFWPGFLGLGGRSLPIVVFFKRVTVVQSYLCVCDTCRSSELARCETTCTFLWSNVKTTDLQPRGVKK